MSYYSIEAYTISYPPQIVPYNEFPVSYSNFNMSRDELFDYYVGPTLVSVFQNFALPGTDEFLLLEEANKYYNDLVNIIIPSFAYTEI